MKMDLPTIKRLHTEAFYLHQGILQKAGYKLTAKDDKLWLEVAADHLQECVAALSIALKHTDEKEKIDV